MNVIVVESPFQLMNAYEYMKINENNILVLRKNENKINFLQMVNIAEFLAMPYEIVDFKTKSIIGGIKVLYKVLNKDKIIIGDYLSFFWKNILKFFSYEKIVLLDDGVATFWVQDILREKNKPLSLFTMFDIKPFSNIQKIFKNEYLNIKKLISNSNEEIDVFIGDIFVQMGLIKKEKYLDILKEKSKSIIYFPHRRVDKSLLNEIKKIEVEVVNPTENIELFLIKNRLRPKNVYGFLSTSFFSLSKIFSSNIYAYKLLNFSHQRKKHIDRVYNELCKLSNVKIIDVY